MLTSVFNKKICNTNLFTLLQIRTASGNQWGLLLEERRSHTERLASEGDTATSLGYEVIQPDRTPKRSILHAGMILHVNVYCNERLWLETMGMRRLQLCYFGGGMDPIKAKLQ